jgi:uncharacterized membrane protein HdeD (DUF308 family)
MDKIFQIIFGVSLVIFGISIFFDPSFYDSVFDYNFDFSEISLPFGALLTLFGIVFLLFTFKKKKGDK